VYCPLLVLAISPAFAILNISCLTLFSDKPSNAATSLGERGPSAMFSALMIRLRSSERRTSDAQANLGAYPKGGLDWKLVPGG
jgi:hypothetical protein